MDFDKLGNNCQSKNLVIVTCVTLIILLTSALFYIFYFNQGQKEKNGQISMNNISISELKDVGSPMAVTKDSKGDLYICDFGNHNVKIYDKNLKFQKIIGKEGQGNKEAEFYMPHAIDFDTEGNIYVTEYGNKRIQVFGQNGNFVKIIRSEKELKGPATSYFGPDEILYVSDFGSNSVIKMSKQGEFLGWIGAKDGGEITNGWKVSGESVKSVAPGGFDRVHSVKFDSKGIMYIIDTWNHRVQRFSKEGKFLGWIGAKSDGSLTEGWEFGGTSSVSEKPGGFNGPIAMDFINNGEIAVLEYGNPRVQRFSKEGKFLGWFGGTEDGATTGGWNQDGLSKSGSLPGAFANAYDLKVYGNKMYIADTGNSRIQIVEFH